jgi:hypothetical protein
LITNVPTNAEEIENGTNSAASQSSASSPFSKLKGFKIGQINIASLVKHYHELLVYMQSKCFDILTVNETRLDKSVCDYEVEIPGYDIINLASQGLYTSARATAKTLVDTGHVTTQILGGI